MRMRRLRSGVSMLVAVGALVAGWAPAARADLGSYLISVDTSGISGTSGYLEAVLSSGSPLNPDYTTVTATLGSISTDGKVGSINYQAGDVSGSFGGASLSLANDTYSDNPSGLSDLQQAFTYGKTLSFVLTLSGPEVNSGNPAYPFTGTIFTFFLEDTNQYGLNNGPSGEAFDVSVNPSGGSLTVTPNNPVVGGGPVDGYAPYSTGDPTVTIAAVPEPSGFVNLGWLMGAGLMVALARHARPGAA